MNLYACLFVNEEAIYTKGLVKKSSVYVGLHIYSYMIDYPLIIEISVKDTLGTKANEIGRKAMIKTPTKYISLDWEVRSKAESNLLEDLLIGLKDFVGGLFNKRAYKKSMSCLVSNLRYCSQGEHALTLLYNRGAAVNKSNPRKINAKIMNRCVDYLQNIGMISSTIGNRNSYNGVASSIKITTLFSYRLHKENIEIGLANGTTLIKLKSFKIKGRDSNSAKEIPLPKTVRGKRLVKLLSKPVDDYHQCWLKHTASIRGNRKINPFCYRVFNNESLELGGRFHGAEHQQMSKDERSNIIISGSETVEPDFKSLHYCLLYWMVGINLDPSQNDPYLIDGFDRKTIKIAMLTLVNISEVKSFKANITKSGNPENKLLFEKYKLDTTPDKKKRKSLKGFITGMPDHINGNDLYNAICSKHHAISHLFCTKDIGLKLQFIDSQIMARILSNLSANNIPALPVHDSIIVRRKDIKIAKEAMIIAYQEETGGFLPTIDFI